MAVPEDLLDLYFTELGRVRLLTADDEVRLAQWIEVGVQAAARLDESTADLPADERRELQRAVRRGEEAFDHFVAANLRLVVSVASQFVRRSSLDLGELIQEGNLGLLRAVQKFDWRRGYKFSTYATWWIRQAIQRGVAGSERTIRLPVALHDALIKVRAARARIEAETGETPGVAELAEATKLPRERVQRALAGDHPTTSLDRPIGFDPEATELGDLVAIAEDSPADEVVEASWRDELLGAARELLDQRSWYVVSRRFGLGGTEPVTLDTLGRELSLSRESVRKIETQALRRLQDAMGGHRGELSGV